MKKQFLFLFAMTLFLTGSVFAQIDISSTNFTFGRNGFAPATMANPITLIGPGADGATSAVTNLDFTFWFAGTPYTQFSVTEDGLMRLGGTVITSEPTNNLATNTNLPKIAPYWDDMSTGSTGSVKYEVTGTTSKVLTVQWYVNIKNTGTPATALIQVQLTESTGYITFTYGTPAVPVTNSASIGIVKANNDFASISPVSATTANIAYGAANNTVAISPGVYTRYNIYPDATPPTITATPLIPNTFGIADRIVTRTIADAKTGIPTMGVNIPRIYYKKHADPTYVSAPGVLQTGGTSASGNWKFTIPGSAGSEGDKIDYFIIAQDQSTSLGKPNISSAPAGVIATDVNNILTPPSTPSFYIIGASFTGTKTVGTGGDYTNLTDADGLFEQINAGQLSGDLTINIISELTETGATALNAWISGSGGPFTITINPVGARTLNLLPNGIRLNGADGINIDGLNDGTNSLTIQGGIKFYAGASDNTFNRLTLTGAGFNSTDASGSFVNCSNNTISNCVIDGGNIYFGSWVGTVGTNNRIQNNVIRNFGMRAIQLDRGYKDFTVSGNEIYQTTGSSYSTGIDIYLQNTVGITNIFNNKIHDLTSGISLGQSTSGIVFSGTGGTLNIYNNEIRLEAISTNTAADKIYGMVLAGASGSINVYHNSIYIGGTGVTAGNSVGFYRTGTSTLNFKNNAVYNARSGAVVSQYYKNYGVVTANTTGFNSDNNLIFANGTSNVLFNIGGQPGYAAGTDYATLALWQVASGKDGNSVSGDPGFTSTTNLMPDVNNPGSNLLDAKGTPIATVTTDILGNPRNATTPDIGAYEFVGIPITYTISGNAGMAGVTLSWTDGSAKTSTSDGTGAYSITVSYGWSGIVTPTIAGYTFTPASKSYANVLANQTAQDYTAIPIVYTISGNAGKAGTTLSWNDGGAKTTTADGSGLYSFTVSYNWSGTVTPTYTGFTFTPGSKTYASVLADQTAQNYSAAPTIITISGTTGITGTLLTHLAAIS